MREMVMNSRERVLTALNHREPDQVPMDFGATTCTSPTRVACRNLREHLGLAPEAEPFVSDRIMDAVLPAEDLMRRYQSDFRTVRMKAPLVNREREMDDDSFYDEYGVRWKKIGNYYDAVERPLAGLDRADLDRAPWPDPHDPGRVTGLREEAQALVRDTDFAMVADIMCGGPFEQACVLRGYDQFCMDLCLDEPFAEALLDKITDLDIALWGHYLDAVGDLVHVVCQGDDFAMQTGLYISPDMYRRFIKPRQKRIFDFVHSRTRAKVFLHCCGSVYDAIPDLIEIGVDILNPLQESAAKMDLARLKREFGKDICFWGGGIDVQQVLPFASLEKIKDEVKRTMDTLAPGGGFVFFPSHNIQADVTPDRLDKAFTTAVAHRGYQ